MKRVSLMLALFLFLPAAFAADPATGLGTPGTAAAKTPTQIFESLADKALVAMTRQAEELKIHGAAIVTYIEGDTTKSWSSKMVVVGSMKNAPTEKDKGANLLAIAYSKASEMAETLKDSGHAGRPPMGGENGWEGGVIKKVSTGYVIAAFSGGPSEADVKVSRAGLQVLVDNL